MSTCSSGSEVLGEGFEEGGEQFVETMREHQDINIDNFRTSTTMNAAGDEGQGKL